MITIQITDDGDQLTDNKMKKSRKVDKKARETETSSESSTEANGDCSHASRIKETNELQRNLYVEKDISDTTVEKATVDFSSKYSDCELDIPPSESEPIKKGEKARENKTGSDRTAAADETINNERIQDQNESEIGFGGSCNLLSIKGYAQEFYYKWDESQVKTNQNFNHQSETITPIVT